MTDEDTIDENVIDKYKNRMLADGKSRNTVKMYSYIASQFIKFINNNKRNINYENIEKFKEFLVIDKSYSKTSVYLYVRALESFLSFLGYDEFSRLKPPKRPQRVPVYLSESDVKAMISNAENLRDRLIIKILAYTGIRVSELCNIKYTDIDLTRMTVKIRSGKGDKDRIVLFREEILGDLNEYIHDLRSKYQKLNFLFPTKKSNHISPISVERIIRRVARKSGIEKKVTPHVLRHTFATTLLRNGADIRIIQVLLGHSNISTTQIYTHVDSNDLRKNYEKFAPTY